VEAFAGVGWGGRLGAFDREIDYYGVLAAADDYRFHGLVRGSVDFLMGDPGRNKDEVPGAGFGGKLKTIAPPKPRPAANDIQHGFEFTMMMGACFGVGVHDYSSGPELPRSGGSLRDRGGTGHTGRLGRVRIEFGSANNADPVFPPVGHMF
jgi:hypothetical protein